jgi:hypothetical protein
MRNRWVRLFVAGIASLGLVATVLGGGWSIVTVRDLPEYAVAGRPVRLTFTVRQHGVTPANDLKPEVTAKSGTKVVKTSAVKTKNAGEYTTTLALPNPGEWTIEIINENYKLPELTVIAAGVPAPPPLSPIALGKRLFAAKGCIGCHSNQEVRAGDDPGIGPDLTAKRFPEAYLKSVLADPSTAFRRNSEPERGEMPNLDLTKSEIAALMAFINRKRN